MLDALRDVGDAIARAQVRHHERPLPAHPGRIPPHDLQRRADIRREVDLVDHQKVGARDARPALRRDFVAGGDVDDVDGQIGQFRRECRGD